MQKSILRVLSILVFTSIFLLLFSYKKRLFPFTKSRFQTESESVTLRIVHWNDLHSRIEPADKYEGSCSESELEAGECFGGFAKIATIIKEKSKDDELMVLDAGDEFVGTVWNSYYKGEAAATIMNAIGVQAMTLGNHEFDYGPEVLADFIDLLKCPVISSNTDVTEDKYLSGKVAPYTIINYKGIDVGVIGYTTSRTNVTSIPGEYVKFYDEAESVQKYVNELKELGINVIICLGHFGYDDDIDLLSKVGSVSLVIGGHSHTLPDTYPLIVSNVEGKDAAVTQAYWASKYAGYIEATISLSGDLILATGELILLGDDPNDPDTYVPDDAEVAEIIQELKGPLDDNMDTVVAETIVYLDGSRGVETNLGDIITDSMIWFIKVETEIEKTEGPVNLSILNCGDIRSSLNIGNITIGDIEIVCPFGNTLAVVKLSPRQIFEMLENGIYLYDTPDLGGEFPQMSGIKYSFCSDLEPGSRVESVDVLHDDGLYYTIERDDEEVRYNLVITDYLLSGGDGYSVFLDAEVLYRNGPLLNSGIQGYFNVISPIDVEVDDRINPICIT